MTLALTGRVALVLVAFELILILVEVAARVWAGRWDARKVAATLAVVLPVTLALMWWRWGA